MRVLMFGWEFPPYQAGGLATATLGLVKGLLRQGLDVTLVVPFPAPAAGSTPIPELRLLSAADVPLRVRTHRIESPLAPYATAEDYVLLAERAAPAPGAHAAGSPYGRNLFEEIERYADAAAEIARREPHDVIDTHDWITFAAGIRAREVSGKPLVAHIHATELDRVGEHGNPEIVRRELAGLRAADRVIANSNTLRHQVIERYGVPADKVDVVHWGVDASAAPAEEPPELPLFDGRPTVLFLGRVTRQKGPEYFVEIAARVRRFVPGVRFLMVGAGDLLPRCIERAVELGLADCMHFAGPLSGAEVDRAYRAADVCVMPSVSEPFGLVALESLRNGTPVIVPRSSGVAEVVRHAFKADFWDVERMADQVVALLRHPELWAELADGARDEIAEPRFGLEEPARRTALSYRRTLADATAVAPAVAPAAPAAAPAPIARMETA
ncbi:MAG TPA: glycosyltransferase family 4 protein [Gemmatimonadales bacterium]|nr:glycosyltransferase family 4 protein [Gemmatimonadales bacterium]